MVYEISAFCFCKSKAPEVLMCVFVCVWGGPVPPNKGDYKIESNK